MIPNRRSAQQKVADFSHKIMRRPETRTHDPEKQGEECMSAAEPKIELEDGGSKGRYLLRSPEGAIAEMTFSKVGERMIIIDHTEVPDAFRGQGVGLRLVTRAVEDARAAGKKIIPLCPFANAQFHRHPEWADVLSK
jgi:hypothetical protein